MSLSDNGDKEFEEAVSKYPSSFDLKLHHLTKPKVKNIRDTLLGKLKNGFVFQFEEMQVYNLISYLSYVVCDIDNAVEYNSKVLAKDRSNGIALANRARFNRHQMNFYDADEDLKRLESLYDNANASLLVKLMSEGEIAQSYARFGPKYHQTAIAMYESIFERNSRVRRNIMVIWKYDYCLCLRRTLHIFNKAEYPDKEYCDILRKATTVLSDIIDTSNAQSRDGFTIYAARAWAELGQLVYNVEKKPVTFGGKIQECIPVHKRYLTSEVYVDRALELGYNDFDVLEICAKFYRYFNKTHEAIELSKKALQLRQTSFCYHHLALSLRKLELCKVSQPNLRVSTQQRGASYRRHRNYQNTPRQQEQSNIKRSIKCGRRATRIEVSEHTRSILENFDKAVELDPSNHFALYDKAFFLRQLRRTEDAKVSFCKLLKSLELCELKINCYEQAGYCCLDMAEACSQQSERYNNDAIVFLQGAIEVAATLAAKVKYTLLEVRPLFPTVKQMLSNTDLLESHDSHMQRLQNLLKNCSDLLPITKEVKSVETVNINSLLEKCLQEERLDEAALLTILDEISSEQNDERFTEHFTNILAAASTSLSNADYEAALRRYQICFYLMELRYQRTSEMEPISEIENDVFLMTDGELPNLRSLYLVKEWLEKYCGLKTVNSDEHCFQGRQLLHSLEQNCRNSRAVFIILKDPKIDEQVQFLTTAIISMEEPERPKLVILKEKMINLPLPWTNVPTVLLPEENESHSDSTISSWLSNVFKAIIT